MFGTRLVQLMPVSGSPVFNRINPDSHSTVPCPAKSVSRQPVNDLPSKNDTQPSPSNGCEGLEAASFKSSVGACRVTGGEDAFGSGVGCFAPLLGPEAQPAIIINIVDTAKVTVFIVRGWLNIRLRHMPT